MYKPTSAKMFVYHFSKHNVQFLYSYVMHIVMIWFSLSVVIFIKLKQFIIDGLHSMGEINSPEAINVLTLNFHCLTYKFLKC